MINILGESQSLLKNIKTGKKKNYWERILFSDETKLNLFDDLDCGKIYVKENLTQKMRLNVIKEC